MRTAHLTIVPVKNVYTLTYNSQDPDEIKPSLNIRIGYADYNTLAKKVRAVSSLILVWSATEKAGESAPDSDEVFARLIKEIKAKEAIKKDTSWAIEFEEDGIHILLTRDPGKELDAVV